MPTITAAPLRLTCCDCSKELEEADLLEFRGPESFACRECVTKYYRTEYPDISQEALNEEIETRRGNAVRNLRLFVRPKLQRRTARQTARKFKVEQRVIGNEKKGAFQGRVGTVVGYHQTREYIVQFDDRPEHPEYVPAEWLDPA